MSERLTAHVESVPPRPGSDKRNPPSISVRLIYPFRAVNRQMGIDADAVWTSQGFPPEKIENLDTRVPLETVHRLLGWSSAALDLPDYGLRAAELVEPGLFDLMEYSARSQQDLGGAVQCVCRMLPLLSDAGSFTTEVVGEASVLTLNSPLPHPAISEFAFGYLTIAARRMTGVPDLKVKEVHLAHPAPRTTEPHERFFAAPIRFGASGDRLVFPADQLNLPLVHADSKLSALFDRLAERLLADAERRSSFTDRVRRLVSSNIASGGASIEKVARELGITPRTLHRRLGEEGLTFRDLTEDVRKGLAFAYLDQRDLSVSEIAYLLGFSGVSAFHHAFKRWTNETPGAYRARHS